ncbi:MAG: DUF1653 domain-containing protein [Lachnospiraceae bacterium]|nr:DUF1653 domain-containing protein [Lachnospiraceae bacterium]
MREEPKALQVYKHFKGTYYQVVAVAAHSETGEKLVIYRPLFEPERVYARPLEMFLSEVDHKKYPDVKQKWRFALSTGQVKAAEVSKERKDDDAVPCVCPEETSPNDTDDGSVGDDFLDRFLNAGSYEEKLDIFAGMRGRITAGDIENIATVMDMEFLSSSVEGRYNEMLNCLKMRAKYECNRLR